MSYRILIVPSSDDEKLFEDCDSIEKAQKIAKKTGATIQLFEFDSEEEKDAFVKGYEAGIGYLGKGLYFLGYKS